eukprot:365737-Chlamydomonas_euryale.AAC.4
MGCCANRKGGRRIEGQLDGVLRKTEREGDGLRASWMGCCANRKGGRRIKGQLVGVLRKTEREGDGLRASWLGCCANRKGGRRIEGQLDGVLQKHRGGREDSGVSCPLVGMSRPGRPGWSASAVHRRPQTSPNYAASYVCVILTCFAAPAL